MFLLLSLRYKRVWGAEHPVWPRRALLQLQGQPRMHRRALSAELFAWRRLRVSVSEQRAYITMWNGWGKGLIGFVFWLSQERIVVRCPQNYLRDVDSGWAGLNLIESLQWNMKWMGKGLIDFFVDWGESQKGISVPCPQNYLRDVDQGKRDWESLQRVKIEIWNRRGRGIVYIW